MNRVGRAAIMLALGGVTTRLLWSGGFGWFVQQRMFLPLVAAAVVLLVFGLYEAFAGALDESREEGVSRSSAGPTVGWMLILPLLVLISVAPTGLGAAAADRVAAFTPTESTALFEPIDTSSGEPPSMRVFDFLDRALWDDQRSLEDVVIRLEGLVVNDPELPDGFKLTRFLVSCCAADGIPLQVSLHGAGQTLPDDSWVVADVMWRPADFTQDAEGAPVVEADVVSLQVIPNAPNDPYESPY